MILHHQLFIPYPWRLGYILTLLVGVSDGGPHVGGRLLLLPDEAPLSLGALAATPQGRRHSHVHCKSQRALASFYTLLFFALAREKPGISLLDVINYACERGFDFFHSRREFYRLRRCIMTVLAVCLSTCIWWR